MADLAILVETLSIRGQVSAAKQFEKNTKISIRDRPGHLRRLDALDSSFRA